MDLRYSPASQHHRVRMRRAVTFTLLIAGVFGALLWSADRPAPAAAEPMDHGSGHQMSDAEMKTWVEGWFSRNPRVGEKHVVQGAPVAAVFQAITGVFDADMNFANGPDTVVIIVGETVEWQKVISDHTVTSGTGSLDPDVGLLFDVPLDDANPVFQYTFLSEGIFPFFCRPHETSNMRGVVIVLGATPTRPTTWGELKARHRGSPAEGPR